MTRDTIIIIAQFLQLCCAAARCRYKPAAVALAEPLSAAVCCGCSSLLWLRGGNASSVGLKLVFLINIIIVKILETGHNIYVHRGCTFGQQTDNPIIMHVSCLENAYCARNSLFSGISRPPLER